MREILTDFALAGAAVLFSVCLALTGGRWLARQLAAIRPYLAALVIFTFVAMNYAQKPGGTNGVGQVEGGTNELMRTTEIAETAGAGTENSWGRIVDRFPQPPIRVAEGASVPSVVEMFLLESVATNDSYSFSIPSNGVRYANWWLRGAYEDVFRLDLGEMRFPCGTNLCDSLWVYSWGMAGAKLGDASNRLVATGVPMSAVPGVSQFWSADVDNGAKLLTWENFFLNRDTNTPVSAQLELMPSGDFVARSNLVETVYRRVNPDDWDDDGIPNDDDLDPLSYDGDNFGPHQELPEGANSNAYCWVDLVVPDVSALVAFTGDGYSALPDPVFIARAGETNRIILLIGKTYKVTSRMPITCVGQSSGDIEVWQDSPTELSICWPVMIEAVEMRSGSSFTMSVWPDCLGGGFTWTNSCCAVMSLGGWSYGFTCAANCLCTGCGAEGYYGYESYRLPAYGGSCGCSSDGEYDPRPEESDDDGPYDAGASATFSKSAVIFEDGYWNTPTNWVERQSTQTELHCVAHGGPSGGHVRFEIVGENKLERVSGHVLPVEQDVSPGKKLDFTIAYKGHQPSTNAEDIVVTTTFTENTEGATQSSSQTKLTSVKVELKAKEPAPANQCLHRREYGIGEGVNVYHMPTASSIEIEIDSTNAVIGVDNDEFYCPWNGGQYNLEIGVGNAIYLSSITVVEPHVYCQKAQWDGVLGTIGCAGQLHMDLFLYVMPSNVSFNGIFMVEIPDDIVRPHDGYFNDTDINKVGELSHTVAAGAGVWRQVHGSAWAIDGVGRRRTYPQPWSNGWKTWEIPVGWGDAQLLLKGQLSPNPTTQHFTISTNGTATIEKYGHVIERRIDNKVFKDGVLQNP